MKLNNLPRNGQIIVFTVIPPGSYTRPGEAYRVEHNGKPGDDFRFVRVATGSGTYDRPHMVAHSKWQEIG